MRRLKLLVVIEVAATAMASEVFELVNQSGPVGAPSAVALAIRLDANTIGADENAVGNVTVSPISSVPEPTIKPQPN